MFNIILLVSTFIASLVLTYFVRQMAIRKAIIDIPNDRSSHSIPTPRGGGVAIVIVWYIALFYFYFNQLIEPALFYALLPGLLISGISFIDDVITLSSKIRFIVHAIATLIALYFLGGFQLVELGFTTIQQPFILTTIAFIAIIWFINLFNFIDGIDGYEASEVIFIGLAAFVLIKDPLMLALVGACLGFMMWNWQKAKIFMGDVGSTLLGFTVAVLAIYYQNTQQSSIVIWLMLSSMFWFDATVTLVRRFLNKENIGQPHRKHAYQRVVQSGFSHQKTVLYALVMNVIVFTLSYFASINPSYSTLFFILNIIILIGLYIAIERKKQF